MPDWSPEAIEHQRSQLRTFEADWQGMARDSKAWSPPLQVDYRLIGSALARVRYELDVVAGWQRNPHFYVHQTLGAVFELLLQPPPFSSERGEELIRRAESMPATLDAARANLADHAVRPFASMATTALQDVRRRMMRALRVGVDVRLALGLLTIDTAADVLAHQVPMDVATAREEASFFASEPGQAITYQIGKLQVLGFLSAARLAHGSRFNLRAFHDALLDNGNVPIALQLWETLGATDELSLLDTASDSLPP